MASPLLLTSAAIILSISMFLAHRFRMRLSQTYRNPETEKPDRNGSDASFSESALGLRAKLITALPGSIISPKDARSFKELMNSYWPQQACEVPPVCVVRPRDAQELSQAVKIVKNNYDEHRKLDTNPTSTSEGIFAVRSGGHSPVAGASSIKGGALIDLSYFNEVTIAPDGKSVAIGAGCKWSQVYEALHDKGLAVAGGRNSAVGVGGLTLGGGLSFFSSRFGMVCSNIIEYEIVLADGSVAKASQTANSDLWRVLKGGANNFGIVTRLMVRSFPSGNIWSGFLYLPASQAPKVLTLFREFLDRLISNDEGKEYDEHAAGPLACFTYLQALGIQANAVALTHTKTPDGGKTWPACWQSSGFSKLWRFWSTCSVKSVCAATDEMSALNPPGRRQKFATTTIKNDQATIEAAHRAYRHAITKIREHNIKNMSWTLVLQPIFPDWARKGGANVLGLDACTDEPLVNVSFTVNWALSKDDEKVQCITRAAIEQIDGFATEHGTGHRYRYINYCDSWQRPFDGYGEDNLEFMKDVSRKYDPDGLFQRGCAGGFKLGL